MVSQLNPAHELYNLRWNSFVSNLTSVITEHQQQETLVDVTLSCEGQFIKAHKLVLSACSSYFQKMFETHTSPQLLIFMNEVKYNHLRLVVQFMYKGEVKVANADMQQFLSLGKMLQVKGLCSVELQPQHKPQINDEAKSKPPPPPEAKSKPPSPPEAKSKPPPSPEARSKSPPPPPSPDEIIKFDYTKESSSKATQDEEEKQLKETPIVYKKRKLPSPAPQDGKKKNTRPSSPPEPEEAGHVPRPPNAFMIFANQWRKKMAVEYPTESNKDISVRLGNMWKSLSSETKDAFYEDARKADADHKRRYPGSYRYYYSPKEARHRKVIANIQKAAQKLEASNEEMAKVQSFEIKCEDDSSDNMDYSSSSNGIN